MSEADILNEFPVPGQRPGGLAWDGKALWCALEEPRKLVCMHPETGKVLAEPALLGEGQPTGLAWAVNSLWNTFLDPPVLLEIEPNGPVILTRRRLAWAGRIRGLTADGAAGPTFWVVDSRPEGTRLSRWDLRDAEPHKHLAADPDAAGLAWDGRWLWVGRSGTGEILRTDPMFANVVAGVSIAGSPAGLAWDGEALWVADGSGNRLLRLRVPFTRP